MLDGKFTSVFKIWESIGKQLPFKVHHHSWANWSSFNITEIDESKHRAIGTYYDAHKNCRDYERILRDADLNEWELFDK
jgi:hypothetical protein